MTQTLYVYSASGLSLLDAIRAYQPCVAGEVIAILYAPSSWCFGRAVEGQVLGSDGKELALAGVYEARLFCATAELRWLNDPEGKSHRAVILARQRLTALGQTWHIKEHAVIDVLPQSYLLWGEGTGKNFNGHWSELATARIGTLAVPVANVGNNRVQLHAEEYLVEREHGNVVVHDSRLLRLEVTSG